MAATACGRIEGEVVNLGSMDVRWSVTDRRDIVLTWTAIGRWWLMFADLGNEFTL